MISVFDYQDPVEFLKEYVKTLPVRKGRGIYNRMAEAAGIFPSYLSQIFSGKRQFNLDQALGVAEFLELKKAEKRYFLLLVEKSRAASQRLQRELLLQIEEMRQSQNQIASRVNFEKVELSDEQQARFYSSWIYAAIRLATALPGIHDAKSISQHLNLPEAEVDKALRFLLETGLCREEGDRITFGPTHTHLNSESAHVVSHHRSWRLKAMEHYPSLNLTKELGYSLVTCLSQEDAQKIRQMLLNTVSEVRKISDPSPSEKMYSFNLDWLQIC